MAPAGGVEPFTENRLPVHTPPARAWLPSRRSCRRLIDSMLPPSLISRVVVGGCRQRTLYHRNIEILRTSFFPLDHAEARGIVENSPCANRHSRYDLGGTFHPGVTAVHVAEMTVQFLQNSDVGILADRQSSELWSANFVCRIDGGTPDQIAQWNTHAEKLGHHIAHAEN